MSDSSVRATGSVKNVDAKKAVRRDAKSPSRLRSLLRRARNLLAIVGALAIINHFFFDLSVIVSGSMAPTLRGTSTGNGDWVLSEFITYRFRQPHRWELVRYLSAEDGVPIMKRVVGLPGETFGLGEAKPTINGESIQPPEKLSFLHYYAYGPYLHNGKQVHCENGYFVLGDDSRDSQDSRFDGVLSADRVRGRPWLRVWPLSRFGFVNP